MPTAPGSSSPLPATTPTAIRPTAARTRTTRSPAVRGLRARGGFAVDIEWSDGQARRVVITAGRSREVTVRSSLWPSGERTFKARAGGRYTLVAEG
ncbi:glycoside hydrolase family 95-like protein [Streptomyces sp. NBC_01589]|uniref:glycoside hydrolase family 95-like protein n=1 Tax=unclassified Streptomyces TaxID=2593676 RepID=UPI003867FEE8